MQSTCCALENQHNAPVGRKFDSRNNRRRIISRPLAPIDKESAKLKSRRANSGALAALHGRRNLAHGNIMAVKLRQCHADGNAQLCSRYQSDMFWDGLGNGQLNMVWKVEPAAHRLGELGRAFSLRTRYRKPRRALNGQFHARPLERQADAAEPSSPRSVQIEKSKVQSGRGSDGNRAHTFLIILMPVYTSGLVAS